jgi:hypothetical protein
MLKRMPAGINKYKQQAMYILQIKPLCCSLILATCCLYLSCKKMEKKSAPTRFFGAYKGTVHIPASNLGPLQDLFIYDYRVEITDASNEYEVYVKISNTVGYDHWSDSLRTYENIFCHWQHWRNGFCFEESFTSISGAIYNADSLVLQYFGNDVFTGKKQY